MLAHGRPSQQVRNEIERFDKETGMSFYDVKEQHGLLRNLMFRNSNTGEWMLPFISLR
jgi:23S rRNA (uracil1939-C5)-methyltransferase